MGMMGELLKDPMFFYSISFVLFFVVIYWRARKPILGWIDGEILKIRQELDEARKLRVEAQAALAETREKQQAALAQSEEIIKQAKLDVERLKERAAAELQETLARHEHMARERIRLAEREAEMEIRAAAVDLAVKIARESMEANKARETAERLIDQSIAEIGALSSLQQQGCSR